MDTPPFAFPDPALPVRIRPRGEKSRRIAGVFLSICFLLFPFTIPAEPVDGIVAAVNYEVITASDLAHAMALNMRLGGDGKDRKRVESETLEGLINRSLLVQEARRLRFVDISDQDISAERDRLEKRFGSGKALSLFLAEQDIPAHELTRMLGERILVERFLEKKVGLFVRVSREEAERYFDEHAQEFKGKRFQDVQKNIIAGMTEQKMDRQVKQYLAELRSKADIRMNLREHRSQ